MPRIVTRPVIASIASVTRLSWRSVVGLRHWLKHATTSITSGMGGCSWCRVGVGFPYSTQCSAALPHRHFGEGIVIAIVFYIFWIISSAAFWMWAVKEERLRVIMGSSTEIIGVILARRIYQSLMRSGEGERYAPAGKYRSLNQNKSPQAPL